MIKKIKLNVSNIDKAIISVHCHNDLGLAVSIISAIIGGARQVECQLMELEKEQGMLEEIVLS